MSWFLLDRNLKLLEPYDWKLSRTVLRGESTRKGADLPDLGLNFVKFPILIGGRFIPHQHYT